MFTADKSASVGMQVWGHVGPRQDENASRSWFSLCARRLPLSPVLQVHGVGRDREAPTDMFQQDAPHVQQ